MNKEERKAIEYYQDKEISFGVNFDTEKLLRALGITEEDNFENHQIRFKTLLNIIEKLQKENEHLHREINRRIKLKIENEKIVDTQFISIQKIKDKIEELNSRIEIYRKYVEQGVETDVEWVDNVADRETVKVLQELIEEREEKSE